MVDEINNDEKEEEKSEPEMKEPVNETVIEPAKTDPDPKKPNVLADHFGIVERKAIMVKETVKEFYKLNAGDLVKVVTELQMIYPEPKEISYALLLLGTLHGTSGYKKKINKRMAQIVEDAEQQAAKAGFLAGHAITLKLIEAVEPGESERLGKKVQEHFNGKNFTSGKFSTSSDELDFTDE